MEANAVQEFYVRTFGFGSRIGMVVGLLSVILGVVMKAVTPENPIYLRFLIFGLLVYVFTRHYKWPFIVVDESSVSILKGMLRKKYLKVPMVDLQDITIGEHAITITPRDVKPFVVQRRLFRPEVWQKLKGAVGPFQNRNL